MKNGRKHFTTERAHGSWVSAAACTAKGIRPDNEDRYVLRCNGLDSASSLETKLPRPAKHEAAGGLFDDLPSVVSGPSVPAASSRGADCLFAVFDGHGGAAVSSACAERLPIELSLQLEASGRDTPEERRIATRDACLALDRYLRVKLGPKGAWKCGTTCLFGFSWLEVRNGVEEYGLLVANLGDTRALLLRVEPCDGVPTQVLLLGETSDHTPDKPDEKKRIIAAGGCVVPHPDDIRQASRVDGMIGCSRALGDFAYKEDATLLPEKQKLSSVPDVGEIMCKRGDVLVICCDGVFDVLSNVDVAEIVGNALVDACEPGAAAEAVIKAALADKRQADNVTCVVALMGFGDDISRDA